VSESILRCTICIGQIGVSGVDVVRIQEMGGPMKLEPQIPPVASGVLDYSADVAVKLVKD
jgi:hypothetical protein